MAVMTFEVGEIAEWCNLTGPDSSYNGQECTILQPREFVEGRIDRVTQKEVSGWGHEVKDSDGEWFAFDENLRKRRSPQDWKSLCRLTNLLDTTEGV